MYLEYAINKTVTLESKLKFSKQNLFYVKKKHSCALIEETTPMYACQLSKPTMIGLVMHYIDLIGQFLSNETC